MKTLTTSIVIGIALLGITACKSKVDSSQNAALESKATALDNQAATVRRDSKVDAADQSKQAGLDADAAKADANARAESVKQEARKTAVIVRQNGEQAAQAIEEKAKETRDQKLPVPEATATP